MKSTTARGVAMRLRRKKPCRPIPSNRRRAARLVLCMALAGSSTSIAGAQSGLPQLPAFPTEATAEASLRPYPFAQFPPASSMDASEKSPNQRLIELLGIAARNAQRRADQAAAPALASTALSPTVATEAVVTASGEGPSKTASTVPHGEGENTELSLIDFDIPDALAEPPKLPANTSSRQPQLVQPDASLRLSSQTPSKPISATESSRTRPSSHDESAKIAQLTIDASPTSTPPASGKQAEAEVRLSLSDKPVPARRGDLQLSSSSRQPKHARQLASSDPLHLGGGQSKSSDTRPTTSKEMHLRPSESTGSTSKESTVGGSAVAKSDDQSPLPGTLPGVLKSATRPTWNAIALPTRSESSSAKTEQPELALDRATARTALTPATLASHITSDPKPFTINGGVLNEGEPIEVSEFDSVTVQIEASTNEISIEHPDVCQAVRTGKSTISLVGVQSGTTRLAILNTSAQGKRTVEVRQVTITNKSKTQTDLERFANEMSRTLRLMFASSEVEVSAHQGKLIVSGIANSESDAKKILSLVRKTSLMPVQDDLRSDRR